MHSNLQRAVADVLAANQEVKFVNVLTAYIRVAGFKKSNLDVLTTFERAMDKHPDCKDQVNSESAKLVAKLRHDYWKTMFDWGGKQQCCPCCVNLVEQYIDDPDKFEEALLKLHEIERKSEQCFQSSSSRLWCSSIGPQEAEAKAEKN